MALSLTIPTHRLINQYPLVMRESLFTYNQAAGAGDGATLADVGKRIYTQPARDAIAAGLVEGMNTAENFLRFFYRPRYVVDELVQVNPRALLQTQDLEVQWNYLKAFGIRTTALVEANVALTEVTPDPAGINQEMRLSVTFASADDIPDLEELQVFFRVADGAYTAGNADFEIEPLRKTVSGLTVTLTGHRGLFVQPSKWEFSLDSPNFNSSYVNYADTQTPADFVSSVDVYRVYPDATNAVKFQVDPFKYGCSSSYDEYIQSNAQAMIVDGKHGLFRVRGLYTGSCLKRPVDNVKVSYLAGYPLGADGRPNWQIVQAICRLANTYMPIQPVSFDDQRERYWVDDRKFATNERGDPISKGSIFGDLIGQVRAYETLRNYALPLMFGTGI